MGFLNTLKEYGAGSPNDIIAPLYVKPREKAPEPQTDRQRYTQAYFSGLGGLSAKDRANWEKKYADKLKGKSQLEKDEYFRNRIFLNIFGSSDDEEDKKIYDARKYLTRGERDRYMAIKFNSSKSDLDGLGNTRESSVSTFQFVLDPEYQTRVIRAKGSTLAPIREQGYEYLYDTAEDLRNSYLSNIANVDTVSLSKELETLDKFSEEISPYYKKYKGTDKLPLDSDFRKKALATFLAHSEVGGAEFAAKALSRLYQNTVADNQSLGEKAVNTGAQFIDSAAGMLIRAAGMLWNLNPLVHDGKRSYLENVIDNDITRYGDGIATTNSWTVEGQKMYKELGLSDNPILNTVDQQNSLMSMNTPFELIGQYGFTTASTILSFGASSVLHGLTKSISWTTKILKGTGDLSKSAKGISLLNNLRAFECGANILVPAAVGTVEGGMNAAMTKEETLKNLNQSIEDRYRQKAIADIDAYCKKNNISQEQAAAMRADESLIHTYMNQYAKDIEQDKKAAEEAATDAMMWDFTGNSLINGFTNTILKSTMQAPKVQNALSKFGLTKGAPINKQVEIARQGDRWTARAKKATKKGVFKGRLKESFGEGLEEYLQDISSAFGSGYAENKMQQYIDNKYGGKAGTVGFETDFWQALGAGISAATEKATSFEAIRSGVYGALSTALGGPNIATKVGKNGNIVASGITWRSAITPLFSKSEVNAIQEQRQKVAEYLNDFFSDDSIQEAFFEAGGATEWLSAYQQSIEKGEEKGARDAKLGAMYSALLILQSLKGTEYYDSVMGYLKSASNLQEAGLQDSESAESKAVEQFLDSVQNRGDNMSREEALSTIKDNANKMMDLIDQVEKKSRSIEKVFGQNVDNDVKASMILNDLYIDNYKKRRESLDEEIAEATKDLSSRKGSSPLRESSRKIIARYGSVENAEKQLEKVNKDIEELEKSLAEVKEEKKIGNKEAKEIYQATKEHLKSLKKARKKLSSDIASTKEDIAYQTTDGGLNVEAATMLTSREILELSPVERAFMLDPKHKARYTDSQNEAIEEARQAGLSTFSDFQEKIRDRAVLEIDYRGALRNQAEILTDSKALENYTMQAKYEARKRMLQKKNSLLLGAAEMGDYEAFAEKLDEIYSSGDLAEIDAVDEMMRWPGYGYEKSREMFYRYTEEGRKKAALMDFAKELKKRAESSEATEEEKELGNLSDNDLDGLAVALDYLSSKGVSIEDQEAGVSKLLEKELVEADSELVETTPFELYRDKVAQSLSLDKTVGGTIESVVDAYRRVVSAYNTERVQQESTYQEITPAETTESPDPAPIPIPTTERPKSIVEEIGKSSPEEGHIDDTGKVVEGSPTSITESAANTETSKNPIIANYEDNSNSEVASAAEVALNIIENDPTFDEEAKKQAKDVVDELSSNTFDTTQEYADALSARANELDSKSETDDAQVPLILRRISSRLLANKAISESEAKSAEESEKDKTPSFFDRRRQAIAIQNRDESRQLLAGSPTAGGMISSVDISYIKQRYPNSWVAAYYDQYGIEDFLKRDLLKSNTPIMFMSDESLAEKARESMESRGFTYGENSTPIVAVVEAENGPITLTVNGEDKHFQPIGIMESTGLKSSPGSMNMKPIRKLAEKNTGAALVQNEDGSPIVTSLYRPVRTAIRYDSSRRGGENNSVSEVVQNDLEREGKNNPAGQAEAKQNFIKNLREKAKNGVKALVYRMQRPGGEVQDIEIITRPTQKTKNKEGETIPQVRNDPKKLIGFNSRTRGAARKLAEFIKKFSDSNYEFINGAPSENTKRNLLELGGSLNRSIGNFLNISTRSGWSYSISATDRGVDGKRVYSINLVNSNSSIPAIHLTDIHADMTEEQITAAQHEFLKNLLTEPDGKVRMMRGDNPLVKWQVNYRDATLANEEGNQDAKNNLSDLYDDNIFEVEATNTTFDYDIKEVVLRNPFRSDGTPAFTVANRDNAGPSEPLNDPPVAPGQINKNGAIIDTETGAILQGDKPSTNNPAFEKARQTVTQIKEDAQLIVLSEDGSHYVNTKTGETYARVTSIIAADEEAGEKRDFGAWTTPSTNIGNSIDEFVRELTSENPKEEIPLPNATEEDRNSFRRDVEILRNHLIAKGLTLVSSGITVSGDIEVADANGKISTIKVAGTLDILAYDGKGNFYIYDMKTHRGDPKYKLDKWARQLSLYKELIEQKYGIQVKELNIIPISVSYEKPVGVEGGTVNYSVSESVPNQLLADGKVFTGMHPILGETISLPFKQLKIRAEKLEESERAMLRNIEEATNSATSIVEAQVVKGTEGDPIAGIAENDPDGLFLGFGDIFTVEVNERATPIPAEKQWKNLSQEQRDFLGKNGVDEQLWNTLTDEEMDQRLECGK